MLRFPHPCPVSFHEKQSQTHKEKDSLIGVVDWPDDQDFKCFVACINQQKWGQTKESFKRSLDVKNSIQIPTITEKNKNGNGFHIHIYILT